MTDLLSNLTSLFTFFFAQMTNFATFFVSTTLGQVLLGCVIFSLIVILFVHIIKR